MPPNGFRASYPCCYFPEGTTPAGRVVQNPGVNGVVKEQKQPVAQLLMEAQRPPQVVDAGAPLRNCFAESVPTLRTARTMITNKRVWILFFMMAPFLRQCQMRDSATSAALDSVRSCGGECSRIENGHYDTMIAKNIFRKFLAVDCAP
jgi:hypothetical protein